MSVISKEKLLKKLSNKEYRDAYAEESVKTSLPFQIKAMREQRDWSQAILGRKSEMKQNAVSRLESAEYGNLSVNTLLRLANAFDCGLLVRFVPFSRLLKEFNDVSPKALETESYEMDLKRLYTWSCMRKTKDQSTTKQPTLFEGISNKDLIDKDKEFVFFQDKITLTPFPVIELENVDVIESNIVFEEQEVNNFREIITSSTSRY